MSSYHLTGLVSALLSTIASAGLAVQTRLLWQRRRQGTSNGQATSAVLSINRFVTSYIIFLAMYTYGGLLKPFNHYLVWPRVLGIVMVLSILFQIFWDRRCITSGLALGGSIATFLASILILPLIGPLENPNPIILPLLVIIVGMIYLQGGFIQINLIRRSRSTGGLSKPMHTLFVYKDLSLVIFALAMGWQTGWPILFTCAVGLSVNLSTLWYFGWADRIKTQAASI